MSRRGDVAFAGAACVVLAGYNNVIGLRPWHRRWYPVVNGCAAVAALGVAAASGLRVGDLGLGRDRLGTGLRLGSLAAAPVVAAFGLAALIPGARPLLAQASSSLLRGIIIQSRTVPSMVAYVEGEELPLDAEEDTDPHDVVDESV